MRKLKSVLLVDDDDTTNFLNSFFVKQLDNNLKVNTAKNGEEAIEILETSSFDEIFPCLLILDGNMPIMNGWEFLDVYEKRFEKNFKKNIVIVMLTAIDGEEASTLAHSNPNVADTAQKPLSDLKFRVLVNKHFS